MLFYFHEIRGNENKADLILESVKCRVKNMKTQIKQKGHTKIPYQHKYRVTYPFTM